MIGGIAMLRTPWVVLKLRLLNFIAGPKPHYSLGGPVGRVGFSFWFSRNHLWAFGFLEDPCKFRASGLGVLAVCCSCLT